MTRQGPVPVVGLVALLAIVSVGIYLPAGLY
jgi:hypothetical protein